jgi:hypothetical protein
MSRPTKLDFILQQGFPARSPRDCDRQFAALSFQPRLIGVLFAFGLAFQLPAAFAALAILLAWSALLPRWSPFDALHNATLGRLNATRLSAAPEPRRFAQGIAATITAGIALSMSASAPRTAAALQASFVLALTAVLLGRFCFGAYLWHRLHALKHHVL